MLITLFKSVLQFAKIGEHNNLLINSKKFADYILLHKSSGKHINHFFNIATTTCYIASYLAAGGT